MRAHTYSSTLPKVVNLGGSPDPPKQSENSKKLEKLQMQQIKQQMKRAAQQAEAAPMEIPKPIVYAAPPSESNTDLTAKVNEARRNAVKKSSLLQSVKAGSTGGFKKQ